MNIAKFAGFAIGLGISVLLIFVIFRRLNTDGSTRTEYDERQKAVRGVGYMYGFYTAVAFFVVMMALDLLEITIPAVDSVLYFTGLVVAGAVVTAYSILHDAYWGMNNNIQFYTRFFIGIGGFNLVYGIWSIVSGSMIENGVLQLPFINLEAGLFIAGIGVLLLVKRGMDQKEEAGE